MQKIQKRRPSGIERAAVTAVLILLLLGSFIAAMFIENTAALIPTITAVISGIALVSYRTDWIKTYRYEHVEDRPFLLGGGKSVPEVLLVYERQMRETH